MSSSSSSFSCSGGGDREPESMADDENEYLIIEEEGDDEDDYYFHQEEESLEGIEEEEGSARRTATSPTSKVITRASLLAAQMEDLQRVMDLLELKEHHARTLLIHHRWNVESLIATLVERGKDQLFVDAGITLPEVKDQNLICLGSHITCGICMEEVSSNVATTMDCGHCFCNDCWTEHFIVKINDGQSKRIQCMAHKCNAICDEAVVRSLVGVKDSAVADKFERFLLESYIEDNNKVKWCPSVPHCGNAIRVKVDSVSDICEVECACGLQFCFSCTSKAHSPCSCLMWDLWSKKCKDESETTHWITAHTKPCPKCNKPVEKSGGCNLVGCVCGQAFCWLCGAATGREHTWTSIQGHSCGRYKEDIDKIAEQAKRELDRYMHYHSRYKAHLDSFKRESSLKGTIEDKISCLEEREIREKDFSWLTKGLSMLFRSRRVLAYSYPFAFYMFGDFFKDEMSIENMHLKQNLFEDQQQLFEATVEKLSNLIEAPLVNLSESDVFSTRMRIINLTNVMHTLCSQMYEWIENDLLGSLQGSAHHIAPYNSEGVERASELVVFSDSSQSLSSAKAGTDSGLHDTSDASTNGNVCSGESKLKGETTYCVLSTDSAGCSGRKRVREKSLSSLPLDLNVPAQIEED